MRDGATGESLPGVVVVHPARSQGTTTNTCGFYSLTLVPSADSLRWLVSALGYERARLVQPASRSFSHDFRLKTAAAELAGVEVVGSREEKIAESTRMGTINVPVAQIKLLPALFGETDVLKVLQLLPGVQGEGAAVTDLWVPATATIKPQTAQQFSLGAVRNLRFHGEDFELSLETYYKPMRNLIEFRDGADFVGTTDDGYENKITSSRGWVYGAELFLQKKTGKTTGWLGCTLSWTTAASWI